MVKLTVNNGNSFSIRKGDGKAVNLNREELLSLAEQMKEAGVMPPKEDKVCTS